MDAKPTLTQTVWIKAAFRALTSGGPQAIKAEAIARSLNVSKGSFYWHFKDVNGLKNAMIEHWQQVATDAVITALDQGEMAPREHLSRLMEIATSTANAAYGGPQAEAAIRDWARYDRTVRTAVATIDQQRIHYVQGLLQKLGQDRKLAAHNARILYAALIGLAQISGLNGLSPQQDLLLLLDRIIAE
ncbi:MAG: TetR/AcrR family transcriptional regulator [Paracoccaceae bacterium]